MPCVHFGGVGTVSQVAPDGVWDRPGRLRLRARHRASGSPAVSERRRSVEVMRILHTSDWHLGRTFHGTSTLAAVETVLRAMIAQVREHRVDLVVVAGDVFDSVTPAAATYALLTETLLDLRDAGASVIVTSGNHDSAARLGFQAPLLREGIRVLTDPARLAEPVTVHDAEGPVHVYGIPFLEPSLVRHLWPDIPTRTQHDVLGHAMSLVRDDLAQRGGRSILLSHCFAAGVDATPGVERDITQGGIDLVPLSVFDGPDYVALGHIHGRATLSERVRYSGAPLHYSFGERDKPRGAWLVDLDAAGLAAVTWLDLPVPRRLAVVRGTFDELLSDPRFDVDEDAWVSAEYTDAAPQPDPMRRLRERFPWCATVAHTPAGGRSGERTDYGARVRAARDDVQLVDSFLAHVRVGEGLSDDERAVLADALAERSATEAAR